MSVVQHRLIGETQLHEAKQHALGVHTPVAAGYRNRFVMTDPVSGLAVFSSSWPKYAGDPVAPDVGDVWYDTVNDRFRGRMLSGVGTFAFTLD